MARSLDHLVLLERLPAGNPRREHGETPDGYRKDSERGRWLPADEIGFHVIEVLAELPDGANLSCKL